MRLSFRLARPLVPLALVAAATLCAGPASAQFSYQVINSTFSGGDPALPVTDDVTFSNLQIFESFSDGYSNFVTLPQTSLDTAALFFNTDPFANPDPTHGSLTSALLTGTIGFDGFLPSNTLDLTLQPTLDPASQVSKTVSTSFSTSLFGPAAPGATVGVGQFSLLNGSGDPVQTVNINVAPVPEASTMVSLGLMVALSLGGLSIARRRRAAQAA